MSEATRAVPLHLVVVPHTHWDREWYQPFQEFRRRLVRLTDKLLDLLEGDASFRHFHFDGQTIVLEDYLEIRPHNRQRLRRLIGSGRIAVGPWYVLPDEFLVSGESIVRNLQIGHRIAAEFGKPQKIGYLPDQFGHIAQMPQILRNFGIEDAVVWRGVGDDVDRTEFLWEAPDGSRVFTVYLPAWGYSNGQRLPAEPALLAPRLAQIVAEHQPFRRIDSVLVMNGTDHQEPRDGLPAALKAVIAATEGMSAEIAPLARYIERAREAVLHNGAGDSLPLHRGELRSCARMHLLPGVTSMRVRQKQRDFTNVALLERYAEPLATWEDWLAGKHDYTAFTDWAWKMAVQNHPHDSICGCSVDQVHRDMEYRFDQVESVGRQTLERALAAIARRIDTSALSAESGLLVYNPNAATHTAVIADIKHHSPHGLSVVDAHGRALPTQVEAGPTETLLDAEMPPAEVRPHIQAMSGREILGVFINEVMLRREGSRVTIDLIVDRMMRGSLDIDALRRQWLSQLDDPAVSTVRILARSLAAARLAFEARLEGHGLTAFALVPGEERQPLPFEKGENWLENRFYRVEVLEGGALRIVDKETGVELPRCNRFVDEGDRGDEYNFDALLDPQPVTAAARPADIRIEAEGPVAARLRLRLHYDLPKHLDADRETRSAELVGTPIETVVTLYAGVKRIDFETSLDNGAKDHRLRVHFETPVRADRISCEQAFAVVERSLKLELNGRLEDAVGTVPQKTFSCIEAGGVGVALFNRGVQEIEAVGREDGTDLALTLLRAVGWLSRGDLRMRKGHAGPGMETPEGQSPGPHRFEYALTTYSGTWADAQISRRAHEFAYPALCERVDRHPGDGTATSLVGCDNPSVVISAVTPAHKPGGFFVRCYNSTPSPQSADLRLPGTRRPKCVDFLGKPTAKALRRRPDNRWRLQLQPFEIANVLVMKG
jgi:alpha-mannosidase